jgi:predicted membrane protein
MRDPYSPEHARTIAYGPLVWGAILVVVGSGWLLGALDIADVPWRALIAAVLAIVGIVMVAASNREDRPEGLFGAGIALSIILALMSTFSAAFSVPLSGGVGNRSYQPTIETLDADYHLVAGELLLHLDDVVFPAGETQLSVGVTFGRIVIDGIGPDVAVSIDGRAAAGELVLLDSLQDGVSIEQQAVDPGFAEASNRLFIDARVGVGKVEVYR